MRKVILLHVPWHLMQVDAAHWAEISEALARLVPPGSNLTEPRKNFITGKMQESAERGQINLTQILLAQTISQIEQRNYKVVINDAIDLPDTVKTLYHGIISVGKANQEFPRMIVKGNTNTAGYTRALLPEDNLPLWKLPIDDDGQLHHSVQHAWSEQKERFLQEVAANAKQVSDESLADISNELAEGERTMIEKELQQRYDDLMLFKKAEITPLSEKLLSSKKLPPASAIQTRSKLINSYLQLKKDLEQLWYDAQAARCSDIVRKTANEIKKAGCGVAHGKTAQTATEKRLSEQHLTELKNELVDLEAKQDALAALHPDTASKPSPIEIYQRSKFQSQIKTFKDKFETSAAAYRSMGAAEDWETVRIKMETIDRENKNAMLEHRGYILPFTDLRPAPNFAQAAAYNTLYVQTTAAQIGIRPAIKESTDVSLQPTLQQRYDDLVQSKTTDTEALRKKLMKGKFLRLSDSIRIRTQLTNLYEELIARAKKLSQDARIAGDYDIAEKADEEIAKIRTCISHGRTALNTRKKKMSEEKLMELKKELFDLELQQNALTASYPHTVSNPSSEERYRRLNFQPEIDTSSDKFEISTGRHESAGTAQDWETSRIEMETIDSENKNTMRANDDYFSQFLPLEERHLSDAPFHQFTQSSVASLRTGKRSAAPATITAAQAAEEDITLAHSPAKKQPRL